MKRQTAEAVESAFVGLRAELTRAEGDRQHMAISLDQSMNEVTALRNKYEDYEDWDEGDDYEEDDVDKWCRDDTGYTAAKGVGEDLGYRERVRRAAAPLFGPQSTPAAAFGAPDLITTARKAAQSAAIAASDMRTNAKKHLRK